MFIKCIRVLRGKNELQNCWRLLKAILQTRCHANILSQQHLLSYFAENNKNAIVILLHVHFRITVRCLFPYVANVLRKINVFLIFFKIKVAQFILILCISNVLFVPHLILPCDIFSLLLNHHLFIHQCFLLLINGASTIFRAARCQGGQLGQ